MEDMLKSLPISKYSTSVEEQLAQDIAKHAQDDDNDSDETDIYWPKYQPKPPAATDYEHRVVIFPVPKWQIPK